MKRRRKISRIVALAAAAAMALCMMPQGAFAETTNFNSEELSMMDKGAKLTDVPGPNITKNRYDAAVIKYLYLSNLNQRDASITYSYSEFITGKVNKGSGECYGYAERCRALFGSSGGQKSVKLKSTTGNIKKTLKKLRPGTHIRMGYNKNTGFHSICFLGMKGNKIYYTDTPRSRNPMYFTECKVSDAKYNFYPYILWYSQPKGRAKTRTVKVAAAAFPANGTIELAWLPVKGAKKYTIYRSTKKTGKYKKLKTTKNGWYVDRKAGAGTYYYRIRAIGAGKISKPVRVIKKLMSPAGTITYDSTGFPSISWNKVKGARQYRIYRQTKNFKWKFLKAVKGTRYNYVNAADFEEALLIRSVVKSGSKANSKGTTVYVQRKLPAPTLTVESVNSEQAVFKAMAKYDLSWISENNVELVLQRKPKGSDKFSDWEQVTLFKSASGKKNFDYSKEFTITDVDRAGDKYTYRAILKMYDSKGNFEESGVPSSEVYI